MLLRMLPYASALLSGVSIGIAWWLPGSLTCSCLGWLAVFTLLLTCHFSDKKYLPLYTAGVAANLLGFYWLRNTIANFGGFGFVAAWLIFFLFVGLSALQYPIFFFVYRHLPESWKHWGVGAPSAWICSELVSVRIFPWHFGHTQLGFTKLVQIADIGGSLGLSFLMFMLSEAVFRRTVQRDTRTRLTPALIILLLSVTYGSWRHIEVAKLVAESSRRQTITMIQANISIGEKNNIKYFKDNTDRYFKLSRTALRKKQNGLLIWPESAYMEWFFARTKHIKSDPRLPYFGNKAALLIGTLTFDNHDSGEAKFSHYNSALAILPDGKVLPPYHKQILMPFGEYMPFATLFPWLKKLNPGMYDFTAGRDILVFDYPVIPAKNELQFKVAPLICYEDVVQKITRTAVRRGAEVLVNLTNDAWFGESVAPYQHNLIASFRALENRRFLLRSTNSGLTAVIDPLGRTTASIPIFSEGILTSSIVPLNYKTIYTFWLGNYPWWLLTIICACLIIFRKAKCCSSTVTE